MKMILITHNVNNDDVSTTETSNRPHPNLSITLQKTSNLREKQVHRQLQAERGKLIFFTTIKING